MSESEVRKRKTISKGTRFEVFKRDGFKCQYCGATAPEAVLVVDHIEPFSKGGADDMMNYITACQPCNAGKSDKRLSDDSALQKQRAQLDELSQRREQLEMMLQWRDGLRSIDDMQVDAVADKWSEYAVGWHLNDKGRKEAKALLKKHGLEAILDAMETAANSYIKQGEDGKATAESVGVAWQKVGGILRLAELPEQVRQLHYIKGILRNRLNYVPVDVVRKLTPYLECGGLDIAAIKQEAKDARSWTQFIHALDDLARF